MKTGGRGVTASRERFGLRCLLVVSQVTLSLVLLVGALLFVRSLANSFTLDAGFQQDGIPITNLDMRKFGFSADRQRTVDNEILERLRRIPGVESAAIFTVEPLSGMGWNKPVTLQEKNC